MDDETMARRRPERSESIDLNTNTGVHVSVATYNASAEQENRQLQLGTCVRVPAASQVRLPKISRTD
jgi:hypothetical protein